MAFVTAPSNSYQLKADLESIGFIYCRISPLPRPATNLAVLEPLPLTIDQAGNFVLEAPDAELLGVLLNQLGVERFGLEADDGVGQRLPALFVEERAGFILDDRLARPAGRKGDDR